MEFFENVSLKDFTTFKIGGPARYFCHVKSVGDLKAATVFAAIKDLPLFILGGGSNIVVNDHGYSGVVAKIEIRGMEFVEREEGIVDAISAAGENWDEFVAETVRRKLYGLENLSGIPGTVGAAPVQNIGAYGVELKDMLYFVEVFDKKSGRVMKLLNNECRFGYRDSIFKRNEASDWVIIRVVFRLAKKGTLHKSYKDVASFFEIRGVKKPTLKVVREVILNIRSKKFPDVGTIGTAGSFFKNPIVSEDKLIELKKRFPDLPSFSMGKGEVKIPLAWILDNVCGLKGTREGDVGVWEHQALVLVNFGNASARDLTSLAKKITDLVKEKANIEIELEVQFIR